jgi:hypothetical protein
VPVHVQKRLDEAVQKKENQFVSIVFRVKIQKWLSFSRSISVTNAFYFIFIQAQIKKTQNDLQKLLSKIPRRPRETLEQLDEKSS